MSDTEPDKKIPKMSLAGVIDLTKIPDSLQSKFPKNYQWLEEVQEGIIDCFGFFVPQTRELSRIFTKHIIELKTAKSRSEIQFRESNEENLIGLSRAIFGFIHKAYTLMLMFWEPDVVSSFIAEITDGELFTVLRVLKSDAEISNKVFKDKCWCYNREIIRYGYQCYLEPKLKKFCELYNLQRDVQRHGRVQTMSHPGRYVRPCLFSSAETPGGPAFLYIRAVLGNVQLQNHVNNSSGEASCVSVNVDEKGCSEVAKLLLEVYPALFKGISMDLQNGNLPDNLRMIVESDTLPMDLVSDIFDKYLDFNIWEELKQKVNQTMQNVTVSTKLS